MMEKSLRKKSCFQVTRTYLFLLLMVLASTASSYAQNVVKGMVMDIADNPLPGVSVVLQQIWMAVIALMCLKMKRLFSHTLVWSSWK